MRRALRSAEILRREVDHRVKNSLQALSSYTRLQSRSFSSSEAKRALAGVGTRIDAMTRLHDQLYRSDDESRVDLGRYVEAVAGDLRGLAPLGVSLAVEAQALMATPQQAVAVGTFINEFVTNSYKHAFPNGRAGRVQITLWSPEPGRIELICADDGVGFPPGADQEATGLGMKIVEVVCLELGCENDMQSSPQGLVTKLNFSDMLGISGRVQDRAS
ncbi:sensor histidine kinase [Thioclava sp. BHET1]|nr:sensor histidine kinase [Thioclava sp. BHET1]